MTKRVPAQFPLSAAPCQLAFVGEAPSVEELIYGQPFVGPAGRVFNALLRSANLEREDVLVTNVFDEKAEDNDCSAWMKDDIRCVEAFDRLNAELVACQPTVIIPLGGTALWAFTNFAKIGPYRGTVVKAQRVMAGAKLLPTFHPEAVRLDWRLFTLVMGDFIKADQEAEIGPQIVYPHCELLIEPTLADIAAFAEECAAADWLSIDIETGWGEMTSIQFAPTPYRAMNIPFVDMRRPNRSYWQTAGLELQALKLVKQICENPVPKLGQNFLYDLSWLHRRYGIAVRNYRRDTRLLHKARYPELPADLGNMAATYTRLGAWKQWGGRYQKDMKKDG